MTKYCLLLGGRLNICFSQRSDAFMLFPPKAAHLQRGSTFRMTWEHKLWEHYPWCTIRWILVREPNPNRRMGAAVVSSAAPRRHSVVAISNKCLQFPAEVLSHWDTCFCWQKTSHFARIAIYFCKQVFQSVIPLSVKNGLSRILQPTVVRTWEGFWTQSKIAQLPVMPSGWNCTTLLPWIYQIG